MLGWCGFWIYYSTWLVQWCSVGYAVDSFGKVILALPVVKAWWFPFTGKRQR